jgi:hypothetical protein
MWSWADLRYVRRYPTVSGCSRGGGFNLGAFLRDLGIDPDDPVIKWHDPKPDDIS